MCHTHMLHRIGLLHRGGGGGIPQYAAFRFVVTQSAHSTQPLIFTTRQFSRIHLYGPFAPLDFV